MNKTLKRVLCAPLCYLLGIHLEGVTGIGMWGDASRCNLCGTDRFDIIVLRDETDGWQVPNEHTLFIWACCHIALPLVAFLVIALLVSAVQSHG